MDDLAARLGELESVIARLESTVDRLQTVIALKDGALIAQRDRIVELIRPWFDGGFSGWCSQATRVWVGSVVVSVGLVGGDVAELSVERSVLNHDTQAQVSTSRSSRPFQWPPTRERTAGLR